MVQTQKEAEKEEGVNDSNMVEVESPTCGLATLRWRNRRVTVGQLLVGW